MVLVLAKARWWLTCEYLAVGGRLESCCCC